MNTQIKEEIKSLLIESKEKDLFLAIEAHQKTKEYSQADDMKQEGKYDTRAIEANYLKDAQAMRISEIKWGLKALKEMITDQSVFVRIGSLVKTREDELIKYYFLTPSAALKQLESQGLVVSIITQKSPLGEPMMGLEAGDGFEVEIQGIDKYIEILEVL